MAPIIVCLELNHTLEANSIKVAEQKRPHMAEVEERLGVVNPCATTTEEEEEEELELNPETFSALAEFYKEQEERERRQAEALTGAGGEKPIRKEKVKLTYARC